MAAAISVFSGLCAAATAVRFIFLFFTMQYFFFFRCAALTAAAAPSSLPYAAHSKYKPYRNHSKDRIIKRFHFLFLRLSMRTYADSLLSARHCPIKTALGCDIPQTPQATQHYTAKALLPAPLFLSSIPVLLPRSPLRTVYRAV